jgi:hypothetical protein
MQSDGSVDGASSDDNYDLQMEACHPSKKGMLWRIQPALAKDAIRLSPEYKGRIRN